MMGVKEKIFLLETFIIYSIMKAISNKFLMWLKAPIILNI